MGVQSFSHVGICVADLERSTRFYVEVLGFRELFEIARRAGGQAWPETLTELDGSGLEGEGLSSVYVTDPDGVRIECIAGMPDLAALPLPPE